MKKAFFYLLIFASFEVSVHSQQLVLGNPSNASADTNLPNNYLVVHKGFILSYNRSRGAPNWVAWHLQSSDVGDTERSDFISDDLLPASWRIKKSDYTGSGYDRGHMCPSKDRSDTEEANQECFVMSNMQPQTAQLNRNTWKDLEEFTRDTVKAGNEAYIYAGCYGNKGRIKSKVTIPAQCFKIILILPLGTNDLKRITVNTRMIAVIMPNRANIDSDWRKYLSSVDDIEAATGFDFLSRVPKSVQTVLEKKKTVDP